MTTPDVPHRFELELVVPGTPEQVWDAIATADGISAWMMPTDLEPREGGAIAFHMGPDVTSHGTVTAWEPNRRVEYAERWDELMGEEDATVTPLVTEFLVEARAGGTCVVRVVTSAFGVGADWENEFFEEMDRGWAPMLDNLRLYLTHFAGRRVTRLFASAKFPLSSEPAIDALRAELGVANAGETVAARGISGRVERTIERHFLLRLESPVEGFISFFSFGEDGESEVQMHGSLFSDDAAGYVGREQPEWQAWLDGVAESSRTDVSVTS